MSSLHRVVLFVVLLSCFYNTRSCAKLEDNINDAGSEPIQMHIALPINALPVNFSCTSGSFIGRPQTDHQWSVPSDRVEHCHAVWGLWKADFDAFAPSIDLGHPKVFWLVKLDGFYHGWEGLTWDKRASWNH